MEQTIKELIKENKQLKAMLIDVLSNELVEKMREADRGNNYGTKTNKGRIKTRNY